MNRTLHSTNRLMDIEIAQHPPVALWCPMLSQLPAAIGCSSTVFGFAPAIGRAFAPPRSRDSFERYRAAHQSLTFETDIARSMLDPFVAGCSMFSEDARWNSVEHKLRFSLEVPCWSGSAQSLWKDLPSANKAPPSEFTRDGKTQLDSSPRMSCGQPCNSNPCKSALDPPSIEDADSTVKQPAHCTPTESNVPI